MFEVAVPDPSAPLIEGVDRRAHLDADRHDAVSAMGTLRREARVPVSSPTDPHDGQRPPSAEALMAATMGLMTAHAQASGDRQRHCIARLVESNLAELAEHPALSPHFRLALSALGLHWQMLDHPSAAQARDSEPSFSQAEPSWTH